MRKSTLSSGAFSLIEVALAIGVASVSLIAVFGLLVTGTQINHTATEQSASSDILAAVAADLRATPKTTPIGSPTPSPQFQIPIPANPVVSPGPTPSTLYFNAQGQCSQDSQGNCSSTITSDSRYRLIVTFLPNGSGSRIATFADLKLTWPAVADPTNINTGSAETFVALDRN